MFRQEPCSEDRLNRAKRPSSDLPMRPVAAISDRRKEECWPNPPQAERHGKEGLVWVRGATARTAERLPATWLHISFGRSRAILPTMQRRGLDHLEQRIRCP